MFSWLLSIIIIKKSFFIYVCSCELVMAVSVSCVVVFPVVCDPALFACPCPCSGVLHQWSWLGAPGPLVKTWVKRHRFPFPWGVFWSLVCWPVLLPLWDLACLHDLDFVVCLNVMSFSDVYVYKSHWLGTFKRCSFMFGVKGGLLLAPIGPTRGGG